MIPTPPAHGAAAHGLNTQPDWAAVRADLAGLNVSEAPRARRAASKDFYWYSPVLADELRDCVAELVVRAGNEDDVRQVARVAARHRLPLTVRGGGTGNYGQCVPLAGGLVLDMTGMQRVLALHAGSPGRITVEAGARMHDIDLAAREIGQALRMWPSTWRVATIAGFIAGGFGGVGSVAHGVLRDPGNLLRCRVVTVEPEPQVIELVGDEIQQVHHAYGTNGVITEVELALSPAVEWRHVVALFADYGDALRAAMAASRPDLQLFLLSTVDRRFAPYYPAFGARWPADRHALFAMVAPGSMPAFDALMQAHHGHVSLAGSEAELEAQGLPPAYECAYNHTTLQVLKQDRRWTYLQIAYPQPFDPAVVLRHLERFGEDMWQHQEFARMHGQWATFALVLTRWHGIEHQYELVRSIESDGCIIFNPHVVTIEDGGMKTIDNAQIDFKRRADPLGLMNPGKTRGWTPEMARRPLP